MEEIELIKISLIGDTNVGKSCLLDKFINNSFKEDMPLTIGIEFGTKIIKIKKKSIKLQILDTSGTRIYRDTLGSYLKGCHGFILVYNITDTESFKNIPDWISYIEKYTSINNFKILVGNKCDIPYRNISEEEGKKLAQDYGMSYFETSAKTGQNVKEIFHFFPIKILNLEKEESPIKNENKGFLSFFHNLINKTKIDNASDNKNDVDNEEINQLKVLLKQERLKSENLTKKVEKLSRDIEKQKKLLDREKNKNDILEEKIKKIQIEYEEKLSLQKKDEIINSKDSLIKTILEKDKEVNELKKKLSRYPFELNEGEKMITINFISTDQKINNYSIICKNTDIFNNIEKMLYDEFKEFYETENYFTVSGKKIHKLKSLDENNIKNNDVIILNIIDI